MLSAATNALNSQFSDSQSAIDILERARSLIDENHPEEIDLGILNCLRYSYYQVNDLNKAAEIGDNAEAVRARIESCNYLTLARYFKEHKGPYRKFLEIAASIKPTTDCSRQAKLELESEIVVYEPDDVSLDESIKGSQDIDGLMNKPSTEFTHADCSNLLNKLEVEMRRFVSVRLSTLAQKWWRQRVPEDVRSRAEQRKQEREKNLPGMTSSNWQLYEFWDFTDLAKIITMRLNWDDCFKEVFRQPEFVNVKLGELSVLRNDVAHNRDLPAENLEIFVSNSRQLLRAIKSVPPPTPPALPSTTGAN